MVKVAITGGTSGVGFEACKQLCAVAEVTGVVLTSRSSANAEKAIERLRSATGKDGSFFEYVVLDLEDLPSIVAAISSFPKVDRICLNGSRLGKCKLHAQSMVTDAMASVLGHTVLTDGLVAAGKLNAGARIVHIGGEIARPLWSFIGLLPNFFSFAEGDLDAAITQNCCCCLPIRMQLGDYKNTKIVGPLFYAGLAAEQSDFHVMSVSPGAMTDTSIFDRGFFPAPCLKHLSCLFYCLQVTHPVAEGAKRYVSVLTGEPSFPAGAYAMSGTPPPFCCCLWGPRGRSSTTANTAAASTAAAAAAAQSTWIAPHSTRRPWPRCAATRRAGLRICPAPRTRCCHRCPSRWGAGRQSKSNLPERAGI